jgi:uncharacterized protein
MSQNVSPFLVNHRYQEDRESIVLQNEEQKIFGIFHKPRLLKKYPAVLFCHGLGGNKVGHYRAYVELASAFASMGIASLRIDFRGSGDSEGDFASVTLDSEVKDACKGIEYLKMHPEVDPLRIAVFGRSMGSVIAIMAANRYSQIRSLGLWAPIFSSHSWEEKWKMLHAQELTEEHKNQLMTFEGQKPGYGFFKEFFSMDLEASISGLHDVPMLLIHGGLDDVVTPDHSEKILKNRLKASAETKLIQLPNSDHHFSNLEERQTAFNETCKWFAQTLNNSK